MLLLKNGFLEKIETWHVGLSCQYTHFMSFSSKSEHDTVADQATLSGHNQGQNLPEVVASYLTLGLDLVTVL